MTSSIFINLENFFSNYDNMKYQYDENITSFTRSRSSPSSIENKKKLQSDIDLNNNYFDDSNFIDIIKEHRKTI